MVLNLWRERKNEGFVAHLKKELVNYNDLISFQCILHQQNLWVKSVFLDDTLKRVGGRINLIRANSMKHLQFRHMLTLNDEIDHQCKFALLSKGALVITRSSMSENFVFVWENNSPLLWDDQNYKLSNANSLQDTAFLCDIISKKNELNIFCITKINIFLHVAKNYSI